MQPRHHIALGLVTTLCLALGGCGDDRPPEARHAQDRIDLDRVEGDVFVATHLAPRSAVAVLAEVPQARYERGTIVLTGGREVVFVQPHAWEAFTGTALTIAEAERLQQRTKRIDRAFNDATDAIEDLRDRLLASDALLRSEGHPADGPGVSSDRRLAMRELQLAQDLARVERQRNYALEGLEQETAEKRREFTFDDPNQVELKRLEVEQRERREEIERDHEARIAELRAAYQRERAQLEAQDTNATPSSKRSDDHTDGD